MAHVAGDVIIISYLLILIIYVLSLFKMSALLYACVIITVFRHRPIVYI